MAVDRAQQTTIDPEDFAVNQPIRAVSWQKMNRQTNFLYAASGTMIASMVFDPPFTTSSSTYTPQTLTSDGRSLDTFRPCFSFRQRAQASSVDKAIFEFKAYTFRCDVRFYLVRDQSTAIGNATISGANAYQHGSASLSLNWATVFQGGSTANPPAVLSLYVYAKSFNGSSTGSLFQLSARSKFLDASDLPITE